MAAGRIALQDRVMRGDGHVETRADGQVLMMSLERGRYFALEATGQQIWDLIAEPVSVGAIVDALTAEYDVDRKTCEAEVMAFLEDLEGNGLLARQDA